MHTATIFFIVCNFLFYFRYAILTNLEDAYCSPNKNSYSKNIFSQTRYILLFELTTCCFFKLQNINPRRVLKTYYIGVHCKVIFYIQIIFLTFQFLNRRSTHFLNYPKKKYFTAHYFMLSFATKIVSNVLNVL